jgi:small subunit ribosomal protein S20
MPIIKSAKKRVRVAEKAAIRNSKTKRSLRTALKAFTKAISGGDKEVAAKHNEAQSNLDKAAKKGLMHKNKVARAKRQLAAKAKAASVAPAKSTAKAAPKKAASKAAPKKVATKAKTTAAKKPAAKKA